MADLTREELRALQQKSLEMAVYFRDFCKENDLLCYFCGGCCIGALRHQGFIPWDDDADFFMPREDYERMLRLWPKKAGSRYVLVNAGPEMTDRNLFATIRDRETTVIKPYQQDLDICHGLAMDILPLDGYPDSAFRRKKQVFWALLYSLFRAQTIPEKHGGLMAFGSKVLLGAVRSKKLRYKIWRMAERHMTRYKIADCTGITELCSGPGYMRNRYPKELFASAVYKEFEGELMPLPVGYDQYLRIVFGDYMQLPPPEKQAAHHDAVFYDLETGYEAYREKYYCVK
ncbi:MAG: 2-C-methyl-D-erythritol 4-phosphate cytidylyltransferase [Clostridiales bacterium]|nr:2-C-methyl-D-erythritol 4-phosphate cytidylyltransferase [Clostridiales bacterium]